MIIRDEEGRPISAEKVSDVSDELAGIEKKLRADVKKMSDEEKKELINELSELQDIIGLVTPRASEIVKPD